MPSRVLRCNIVLRDDGKRLGLHPRGQAGQQEDGGMMEGWQDDGRMVGRWVDGGTMGG